MLGAAIVWWRRHRRCGAGQSFKARHRCCFYCLPGSRGDLTAPHAVIKPFRLTSLIHDSQVQRPVFATKTRWKVILGRYVQFTLGSPDTFVCSNTITSRRRRCMSRSLSTWIPRLEGASRSTPGLFWQFDRQTYSESGWQWHSGACGCSLAPCLSFSCLLFIASQLCQDWRHGGLPNKRLKLTARVDCGMNLFQAPQLKRDPLGAPPMRRTLEGVYTLTLLLCVPVSAQRSASRPRSACPTSPNSSL